MTRGNINLPVKHTKAAVKCQRCCVNRTRGNTLYKVIPQKARGRFLRRIRKRNGVKLSRYQLKCAKKIQDSFNKRLVSIFVLRRESVNHSVIKYISDDQMQDMPNGI